MTEKQVEEYRALLLAMVDELQQSATAIEEQIGGSSGDEIDKSVPTIPIDFSDVATDSMRYDTNRLVLENEVHLLNEVHAALKRLELGKYGRCDECHRPINKQRLIAIPYTRNCVTCAVKRDEGMAHSTHPNVDDLSAVDDSGEEWKQSLLSD